VNQDDLTAAEQRVTALNPKATFTSLPYTASKIEISGDLSPLIESSDCNHEAGNMLDDITCILTLSPRGRMALINPLRTAGGVVVNFSYDISGVIEQADGTYTNQNLSFEVAGRIGGLDTKAYPQLFLDPSGNPIYFDDQN
jgi:hypothetical protein